MRIVFTRGAGSLAIVAGLAGRSARLPQACSLEDIIFVEEYF